MTQIFDLSDPAHPKKIRDFGLPGQEPGATGAVPTEVHGPISAGPEGNRVYFGYGTDKGGFLQIVDREKLLSGPKEPTPDNLRYPEISRLAMSAFNGAHTTFPMLNMPIAEFAKDKEKNRDIVMIVDEEILNECAEPRQMVWFADVTVENRPMMISSYTAREASGGFCDRGGRFGAHSSNESMAPVYYKKMAFISYFNAGVRIENPGIRMPASRTDPSHPWVRWTVGSMEQTLGRRVQVIPNSSGGLPGDVFVDHLGTALIWVPHSYNGCKQHGPDEHFLIAPAREGIAAFAGIWWDLGEQAAPQ
jgi:hypothetical protein